MAVSNNDSKIIFSVLQYLKAKRSSDTFSDEKKESLDVSLMCLQEVFGVDLDNADHQALYGTPVSLEVLFNEKLSSPANTAAASSHSDKEKAEALKNEGNSLMKESKHVEAIDRYTQSIGLDKTNPTYYANRAAAYMKIEKYQKALEDCTEAVRLNPKYAKVYMRMGKIHQALNDKDKAKECYIKAVQIEPDNEEYRTNLKSLEADADNSGGSAPRIDPSAIGGLLNNPMFMNLASSVMSNPAFQNVASNLMQAQMSGERTNIGEMMPQFAQMAQQMHQQNPEMFDALRNQASQFRQQDDTGPSENEEK